MMALDERCGPSRHGDEPGRDDLGQDGPGGAAMPSDAPSRRALSLDLRSGTRVDHDEIERRTGWPGSIDDGEDYRRCLRGLLSIWRPFEPALATGETWAALGMEGSRRSRREALERDLRVLGDDPARVPALSVDPPLDLPGRIGVLYVLEGSALGGRVIRADVLRRLGPGLADATTFFAASSGAPWRVVLAAIDAFGEAHPAHRPRVLAGARQAFAGFLQAFLPGGVSVADGHRG